MGTSNHWGFWWVQADVLIAPWKECENPQMCHYYCHCVCTYIHTYIYTVIAVVQPGSVNEFEMKILHRKYKQHSSFCILWVFIYLFLIYKDIFTNFYFPGNNLFQNFIFRNLCCSDWFARVCAMFLFFNFLNMTLGIKILENITRKFKICLKFAHSGWNSIHLLQCRHNWKLHYVSAFLSSFC